MEMWFSDMHTENVKLSIKIDRQLFSAQSEYQRIDVLDSREFGKILVADVYKRQSIMSILMYTFLENPAPRFTIPTYIRGWSIPPAC